MSLLVTGASSFAVSLSLSTWEGWLFAQDSALKLVGLSARGWLPRTQVKAARCRITSIIFYQSNASYHTSLDSNWDKADSVFWLVWWHVNTTREGNDSGYLEIMYHSYYMYYLNWKGPFWKNCQLQLVLVKWTSTVEILKLFLVDCLMEVTLWIQ